MKKKIVLLVVLVLVVAMPIGDTLAKLAQGKSLSPQETEELRLWGNQTQLNNSYVAGLQNGNSNIKANTVQGNIVVAGKEVIAGSVAYFYAADVAIPDSAYTDVTPISTNYNEGGFVVSGASITVTKSGWYSASLHAAFDPNATGLRIITENVNGVNTGLFDVEPAYPVTTITDLLAVEEKQYNSGDVIKIKAYQSSGGSLNLSRMWVVFRMVRLKQ